MNESNKVTESDGKKCKRKKRHKRKWMKANESKEMGKNVKWIWES